MSAEPETTPVGSAVPEQLRRAAERRQRLARMGALAGPPRVILAVVHEAPAQLDLPGAPLPPQLRELRLWPGADPGTRPAPAFVLRAVATAAGLAPHALLARDRAVTPWFRRLVFVLREVCGLHWTGIAALTGRNHSTCYLAARKLAALQGREAEELTALRAEHLGAGHLEARHFGQE